MTSPQPYSFTGYLRLPAAPGTTQDILWRAYGRTRSRLWLELEQDDKVLASFKKPHRFLKRGTLTLLTPVISQEFIDQIFVSLAAMMEK
jgi:hypothetical protein